MKIYPVELVEQLDEENQALEKKIALKTVGKAKQYLPVISLPTQQKSFRSLKDEKYHNRSNETKNL